MSPLLTDVNGQLLPLLQGKNNNQKWQNCAKQFPWYATPWVMLAASKQEDIYKQKAALWFENEQLLHWQLTSLPVENDAWLSEQLLALENNERVADTSSSAE